MTTRNLVATVAYMPRIFGGARIEKSMAPSPNDLEVLDDIVRTRRNQKVIADAALARAEIHAQEAAENLIKAVEELEAELQSRGSLCRK
jgi:ribosome-associated translation inhibitor RaiA